MQGALRRGQARLVQLAFENRRYAFIGCSLNPQEVSMAVQSIRTPVQVGDIAGDHLFVAAREMSFGKVDCVGELDHLAQEIRPRAEALDDARNLLPSRTGPPEVIGGGGFAGGVGVLDDFDLRGRLCRVRALLLSLFFVSFPLLVAMDHAQWISLIR